MPLQYQPVTIALGGLDTKTHPHAVIPGKLTRCENAVFTKPGVLSKRNGYAGLSKSIENSGGYLSSAKALAVFNDELLLFSGTNVYSYAPATSQWMDRGRATSLIADRQDVIRNGYTQSNPDVAYSEPTDGGGVFVQAWEDSRGGVRYAVQDATSGTWLVADTVVSSTGQQPRLVTFGNEIVLFYTKSDDTAKLFYRRINPLIPVTLGAETNPITTLATAHNFDVLVVGARLFILTNEAAVQLRYLDSAYTLSSATSPMNAMANCVALWTDASQNIWCAGATATATRIAVLNYASVSVVASSAVETISNVQRITGYVPTSTTSATMYYEVSAVQAVNTYVRKVVVTIDGNVGSPADFMRSVGLATRAFQHDGVGYVGLTYDGTYLDNSNNSTVSQQSTTFVVNNSGDIVARLEAGFAGGVRSRPSVSAAPAFTDNAFAFAAQVQAELLVDTSISTNPARVFSSKGISRYALDFAGDGVFGAVTLNNNCLIVGGLLQGYDGVSLTEHNFNLYPEQLTSDVTTAFSITVTTPGGGGAAEVTDIVFPAASRIKSGQYFTITGATGPTTYYVWFNVDGAGGDPAPGGATAIPVAINNYDANTVVAEAARAAIDAVSAQFDATRSTATVTVTNVSVGAVADAANAATPNGISTGSIANGTYQYRAHYEWHDNFGQLHRSHPSRAVSFSASSNPSISWAISTLRLTTKLGARAPVRVVLSRTVASGTAFYRVSSLTLPLNDVTRDYVYVIDTIADASLTAGEALYTLGDVLENEPPAACGVASTYRGRVFLAGLPNKQTLVYSKVTAPDEAVAFAAELSISNDPRGGDITAVYPLDDKQVIFKTDAIFVIAGEGPENTGLPPNAYGDPVLVTSDVGCTYAAGIVTTPNGLMFPSRKGFYLLDRSMQAHYIGAPVEAYNDMVVTGAALVPGTNQVRFVSSDGTCLVYDYLVAQWSVFTNHAAVGCAIWRGQFVWARADGSVFVEDTTAHDDAGASVLMLIETGWISTAGDALYQRVRRVGVHASYLGPHQVLMELAHNDSPVYTQSKTFNATGTLGTETFGSDDTFGSGDYFGGSFQPEILTMHVAKQLGHNIRMRISELPSTYANEAMTLSNLTMEAAPKGKIVPVPATRRL